MVKVRRTTLDTYNEGHVSRHATSSPTNSLLFGSYLREVGILADDILVDDADWCRFGFRALILVKEHDAVD